jgi:hypothetical protein
MAFRQFGQRQTHPESINPDKRPPDEELLGDGHCLEQQRKNWAERDNPDRDRSK